MGRPRGAVDRLSPQDEAAIRAMNRRGWEAMKQHVTPGQFAKSLYLLRTVQGYSLNDIGLMFGVSLYCVDKWCRKYDIPDTPTGGRRRRFNWETQRFEPYKTKIRRRTAAQREADRVQKWATRKAELFRTLAKYPHPPTIAEVAYSLGLPRNRRNANGLATYAGHGWYQRRQTTPRLGALDYLRGVWREAGFTEGPIDPRGGAGRNREGGG